MMINRSRQDGFTIIELLIVIVVIGILAAIVIVAYNGVQDRARASSVKSDLASAKKTLMLYKVDHGTYPTNASSLADAGLKISNTSSYEMRTNYSNFYYCHDITNNTFSIGARAASSSAQSFYVTSNEPVSVHNGVISSTLNCAKLGLSGTGAADGAYSSWGLSATGVLSSWLVVGS